MFADTTSLRALAGRLHERAEEIRDLAARLLAHAAAVPWSGLAADAMRTQVSAQVLALRRTAALHEDAAEALTRHAREVERVQGLLAAAGATLTDLDSLTELTGVDGLGDLAGRLAGGAKGLLS